MILSPDTLKLLMSKLSGDDLIEVYAALRSDFDAFSHAPAVGATEERERARNASTYAERKRAKDRERQRLHRERKRAERDGHGDLCDSHSEVTATSREVAATVKDCHGDPATPRAHVRDITSNSENNHNHTLLETRRDPESDWPEGKAHHHAELICAEMASPWLDLSKSPGLVTTAGRLAAWKRDGASWEHDVLPLIRGRLMNRRSAITTWAFFDNAIGETVAANRAALTIPEAGTVIPFRQVGPPTSRDEKISASWNYAIEKIAADEQS